MTTQFGQWGEQDFVTGKKMRREEPLSSKLQPGQALLLGPVWEWVIMGTPGTDEAPEAEPSAASVSSAKLPLGRGHIHTRYHPGGVRGS